MKKLILTSTGLSNPKVIAELLAMQPDMNKSVAIVVTASRDKENNPWNQLTKQQFLDAGFSRVDFVDLEFDPNYDFSQCGVIFVSGGNTFKLLKFVQASNFSVQINQFLENGGIYIGSSAGSIIVADDISLAGWGSSADENEVGLEDLSALNITEVLVWPHYEESFEKEVLAYEEKYHRQVHRLPNDQALVLRDSEIKLIK